MRVVESCVQSQSRSLTLPALTQCVVFVCVRVCVCVLSVVRAVSLALLAEPEPGPHYAYQSISQGLYEMNGIKD